MPMTQNPVQRLVDELAHLIESQSNLRQTILDLDRRLQGLERAQVGLTHQLAAALLAWATARMLVPPAELPPPPRTRREKPADAI